MLSHELQNGRSIQTGPAEYAAVRASVNGRLVEYLKEDLRKVFDEKTLDKNFLMGAFYEKVVVILRQ